MFKITTLPVYSKLASIESVPVVLRRCLPDGIHLSEHQLDTYCALTNKQYDVVINTAMTGDGKSLAAYLPALVHGTPLLSMYPTNELARDQELQLQSMKPKWPGNFIFNRVSAARLEKMVNEARATRKATALEQLLSNYELILTNPDIFHYIAQFFYTGYGDSPDRIFGRRLVDGFDQFVFDEFHVFETPQVISVVNALLLIREVTRVSSQHKRFLFLSATPGDLLTDYLRRADFNVHVVETDNRYLHTRDKPDPILWRPIIRETEIHFSAQGIEEWIEEHLEDIVLDFFQRNRPGARGAIIVNSVAKAYRLAAKLRPIFKNEGFTVQLNTGLTSDELKEASRDSDLLIGTSTVDVGVDFRINFLVFESRDASTFLQRLGRLGRHEDDGHGNPFTVFQAYGLVPNFVLERLFPTYLTEQQEYTREHLAAVIREAYPTPIRFAEYAREWGRFQCAHVSYSLAQKTVRDTYTETRRNLHSLYWKVFQINVSQEVGEYKAWRKERRQIIEEAQSFRGSSPLQCGVIDMSEQGPNRIKRYSLLSLVGSAELSWLGHDEFEEIVRTEYGTAYPFPVDELAGWFQFHGFSEQRRKFIVRVDHAVSQWSGERLGAPQIVNRIRLDVDGVDWLNPLNRHLERRKLVATLCMIHPSELRSRLRLPLLFELYEFQSPLDGSSGAIAFARQALLLHVALLSSRINDGGGAIFV